MSEPTRSPDAIHDATRLRASVPGSMSGMTKQPVSVGTFIEQTSGRLFRVEDYGPGRVWVQDVMSPTGFGWWEHRERVEGAINAR